MAKWVIVASINQTGTGIRLPNFCNLGVMLRAVVVVNLFILGLSQYGFGHRPWSVYPLVGWGVGLALHGISVFLLGRGSGFRERLLARERERLVQQRERDRAAGR